MPWSPDNAGSFVKRVTALVALAAFATLASAGPREQAKRIHDRIAGVPPSAAVLDQMAAEISAGRTDQAALIAMDNPAFYSVTLKNLVTPWTNREQTVFAPLNDYVATFIGMVRDNVPFNTALSSDLTYTVNGVSPAASPSNNDHYATAETNGVNLMTALQSTTQSSVSSQSTSQVASAQVLSQLPVVSSQSSTQSHSAASQIRSQLPPGQVSVHVLAAV